MHKYIAVTIAAGACVGLSGCMMDHFDGGERFTSDFRYSYALQPGATLSIENSNGSVEIGGWDQNTVEITGSKYAATEALRDEIRIEINHSDKAVAIRTVRPEDRHGNMGARYVIRVLERVVSTNGAIKVNDVDGAARLRTSNGSVHALHVHGDLEAQTTNGSIEAEDVDGAAHLHTSNGQVRTDAVTGAVEATSSNGGIHIHETASGSNQGFRLSTSNGPIELTMDGQLKSDVHATTIRLLKM